MNFYCAKHRSKMKKTKTTKKTLPNPPERKTIEIKSGEPDIAKGAIGFNNETQVHQKSAVQNQNQTEMELLLQQLQKDKDKKTVEEVPFAESIASNKHHQEDKENKQKNIDEESKKISSEKLNQGVKEEEHDHCNDSTLADAFVNKLEWDENVGNVKAVEATTTFSEQVVGVKEKKEEESNDRSAPADSKIQTGITFVNSEVVLQEIQKDTKQSNFSPGIDESKSSESKHQVQEIVVESQPPKDFHKDKDNDKKKQFNWDKTDASINKSVLDCGVDNSDAGFLNRWGKFDGQNFKKWRLYWVLYYATGRYITDKKYSMTDAHISNEERRNVNVSMFHGRVHLLP